MFAAVILSLVSLLSCSFDLKKYFTPKILIVLVLGHWLRFYTFVSVVDGVVFLSSCCQVIGRNNTLANF